MTTEIHPAALADLAGMGVEYGDRLREAGQLNNALQIYRQALDIAARLTEADPDNVEWQHGYVVCQMRIGYVLWEQGHPDQVLLAYEKVIADFGAASDPTLREQVAKALFNKGVRLGALDRSAEEIAVYDDLIARFGTATELPLREPVAKALFNKGITLGALDRSAEEIAVYDDLIARFGTATELPLRELVAKALFNKGGRLGALDRSAEAIAVYDDLIARFGTATELPLRELVAKALVNKGITLGALDRSAEEIAVYDDLIARFGTATELPLREQVANALFNKGFTLGALDRSAEEIAVYDDLIARFGTATELPLREPVANALFNKGIRLGALDRSAEAIAVYDDLIARFGTATELPLRELVAKALVNKGGRLGALDRSAEANATFAQAEAILAVLAAVAHTDIEQNVAGRNYNLGTTETDPPAGNKEAETGFLEQIVANLTASESAADERGGEHLLKDKPAAHLPAEVDKTPLPPKNGTDPAGSDADEPLDEVTAQRQKRDQLRKDKRAAIPVIKHLGTSIVPDHYVLYRYITVTNIDDAMRLIADSGLSIDQWKEVIEKYESANGAVIVTAIPMQDATAKLRVVSAAKEAREPAPAETRPNATTASESVSLRRSAQELFGVSASTLARANVEPRAKRTRKARHTSPDLTVVRLRAAYDELKDINLDDPALSEEERVGWASLIKGTYNTLKSRDIGFQFNQKLARKASAIVRQDQRHRVKLAL